MLECVEERGKAGGGFLFRWWRVLGWVGMVRGGMGRLVGGKVDGVGVAVAGWAV